MEKKRNIFEHVMSNFANGNGMKFLQSLSHDELMSNGFDGINLLHCLVFCMDKSTSLKMLLFLLDHGLDYNKVSIYGNTPSHLMCHHGLSDLVEIMVCVGANMSLKNHTIGETCLMAAMGSWHGTESAKVLLSNGYRLNGNLQYSRVLVAFQQGVLRCRDVIVTLIGLKKRRFSMEHASRILPKLDRFLIQQVLAVEIWTTRAIA